MGQSSGENGGRWDLVLESVSVTIDGVVFGLGRGWMHSLKAYLILW